jgi:nucleotide-binding universal stress UspA family protein
LRLSAGSRQSAEYQQERLMRLICGMSTLSQYILTYAAALAEKFGAELVLLHVVQDLALFIPDAVAVAPPIAAPVEQFAVAAREALERVARADSLKQLSVRREVREGTPFYEIIRFAKEGDVDLIVMGTHGHSGLTHVLLEVSRKKSYARPRVR